jgi:hypothetical protein
VDYPTFGPWTDHDHRSGRGLRTTIGEPGRPREPFLVTVLRECLGTPTTVRVGQTGTITNTADVVASNQRDPNVSNGEAIGGIAASGPTLPPTGTKDSTPAPLDLSQLAVWLLGFALAAMAVLASTTMATRNRRIRPRG